MDTGSDIEFSLTVTTYVMIQSLGTYFVALNISSLLAAFIYIPDI